MCIRDRRPAGPAARDVHVRAALWPGSVRGAAEGREPAGAGRQQPVRSSPRDEDPEMTVVSGERARQVLSLIHI